MKTSLGYRRQAHNKGSALIAILTMLAIMFVLFTVNSKTLTRLSREVDALDKKQTNRLATVHLQPPTSTQQQ